MTTWLALLAFRLINHKRLYKLKGTPVVTSYSEEAEVLRTLCAEIFNLSSVILLDFVIDDSAIEALFSGVLVN